MHASPFKYFLKAGLGLGVGTGVGLTLTVLSTLLLADVLYRFQSGDLVSSDQINRNFEDLDDRLEALRTQVEQNNDNANTNFSTVNSSITVIQTDLTRKPPIGSIVAWHKSLSGVGALPAGWVECNGGTVTETASPLNGQAIPNLNGQRRFLRGGSTSGNSENDAFQGHNHDGTVSGSFPVGYNFPDGNGLITPFSAGSFDTYSLTLSISGPTNGGYGSPRIDTETRPINMSVVWIMRIL